MEIPGIIISKKHNILIDFFLLFLTKFDSLFFNILIFFFSFQMLSILFFIIQFFSPYQFFLIIEVPSLVKVFQQNKKYFF